MSTEKKYWKGIEELSNSDVVQKMRNNEFAEELPQDEFLGNKEKLESSNTSRRDFLKYMGFSTAAATLASCEAPVTKSIPYVVAPEEVIPGIANYYATSYFDGHDYASLLVKTREGRPIKIEPNKMARFNGTANARLQGSVLNLYDSTRLQKPMVGGADANWDDVDKAVKDGLAKAAASGQQVVLLSSTMISPATKKLVKEFGSSNGNFKHVTVDPFSYSAKLDAYQEATGRRMLPVYDFSKADVIVSFNADFLGDWVGQSVAPDYAKRRVPGKDMSRHIQFETNMTITGGSADKRYRIKPSEVGAALTALYAELGGGVSAGKTAYSKEIKAAAAELKKAGSKALVVSGTNDKDVEAITIAINKLLGNSGTTVNMAKRSHLRQGNDKAFSQLVADMNAGKVGAVLIHNLNPAYDFAGNEKFISGLKKVDTSVYFSQKADETAALSKVVCAEHNWLESWGDAMPADGMYSLQQPTIRPLFNTRQMEECLLVWMGKDADYHQYLKSSWGGILGGTSWNDALHDGVYPSVESNKTAAAQSDSSHSENSKDGFFAGLFGGNDEESTNNTTAAAPDLNASAQRLNKQAEGMEIQFYQMTAMGVGKLANNPWLLEMPDPISRVSWDNYLTMSAADAMDMDLKNWHESNGALNGSYVSVTVGDMKLENVPVLIQPGQAPGTVGLAVGYGRTAAGEAANGVGVNAFALMQNGAHSAPVRIEAAAGEHEYAALQLAHTMMGRKIVNETTLDTFLNEAPSNEQGTGWNQDITFATHKGPLTPEETNLWDDFDHEIGHMWNMSIDMNLCTGCGACVIACQSENNVPVVGKEEVRKFRDMHWLRIDRYYSSDMTEERAEEEGMSAIESFAKMEEAGESPDVYFQPVMCQHCNHAPCETVCPVIATSHSSEGLNHMAYNRCIGTRYCANNCPYKVRRFNWFQYNNGSQDAFDLNYAMNDDLGRMVLNPDVVVRSRGVMEKCSMCIQRIQLGKLEAKKAGEKLQDGAVQTACMSACPSDAIVFGDVNDKESKVHKAKHDKRMYHLLEEVGTQPSVFYQTKVRNRA